MSDIATILSEFGVTLAIVLLFLWDWVSNKKEVKGTLKAIETSNTNIASCLIEMKKSNENISKSLEILQKSLDNQTEKIDKLLERR